MLSVIKVTHVNNCTLSQSKQRGKTLLPRQIIRHSRMPVPAKARSGNPDKPFRSSGFSVWKCRSCHVLETCRCFQRRTGFPPSRSFRVGYGMCERMTASDRRFINGKHYKPKALQRVGAYAGILNVSIQNRSKAYGKLQHSLSLYTIQTASSTELGQQ